MLYPLWAALRGFVMLVTVTMELDLPRSSNPSRYPRVVVLTREQSLEVVALNLFDLLEGGSDNHPLRSSVEASL